MGSSLIIGSKGVYLATTPPPIKSMLLISIQYSFIYSVLHPSITVNQWTKYMYRCLPEHCRNQWADLLGCKMVGVKLGAGRFVARALRPIWELRPNGSAGKGFWGGLGFSNSWEKSHTVLSLPPEGGVTQYKTDSTRHVQCVSTCLYSLQRWLSCLPNRLVQVQITACYLLDLGSSSNL